MNISEIARLAGVSSAAVSRFLNHGYLSEEKSEKIRKVIEETGYIPSSQAQMLRTKKTKLIGIIVPKISSEAVSRMVEGITAVTEQYGHQILLANTDNRIEKELEYLNLFHNKQVDGVIFIATIFTKEHRDILSRMMVPVVLLGQQLSEYPSVYYDDYEGAKAAVSYMISKGKTCIACIGVDARDQAAGRERERGYEAALLEAGLEIKPELMTRGAFDMENGYLHARELYGREPGIDGFFCSTDNIAVGAMTFLREIDAAVPDRIAVAGIGDTRMSSVVTPGLTTVHLPYKTGGAEAAGMLMELLTTESVAAKTIKLGTRLVTRDSV